jgi:redox-sensitive bicupin YhaK (pirin superfamily)
MSKREGLVSAEECVALGAVAPALDSYPTRELSLGSLTVFRALPVKDRRLVGPWCFLDRFGPLTFAAGKPMDVAPHPHIGLQTVTWLLDGEVLHDDSLDSEAVLRPGGVNVMTSGGGIAHAEQTPRENIGRLDGVQLWVALPDDQRSGPAAFEHVKEVPLVETSGAAVRVFAGSFGSATSATTHFSELVGLDVQLHPGRPFEWPLDPRFEHGLLVLSGDCAFMGQALEPRMFHYIGTSRSAAQLSSRAGARVLVIGGPPFAERILMWWNFVARTPEEIADARADWEAGRRFGEVRAYDGPRLSAPSLLQFARANPVS